MTENNLRSFVTHDGAFHADEVTACALLLQFDLIDFERIIRTRDPAIHRQCEYVCDVGGKYISEQKLFDHHQVDYQGNLSSAGMVLLYLKESEVIDGQLYDFLNKALVIGVDAHDNGKELQEEGVCTYSHIIANFAPIPYDCDPKEQEIAFFDALDFANGHIHRILERYRHIHSCRQIVAEIMESSKEVMIFDKPLAWMDLFFEMGGETHPAKFVVMPSGSHWKLRGIPPNPHEKMKVRYPLPMEWAGLMENELKKASGIPGAIFCHKGRFISIWETKEDALKALNVLLEHKPQ